MEKRGGRITTFELLDMRISQYQARFFELREKGYDISEAIPIHNQQGNFEYVLRKKLKPKTDLFELQISPWD